MNIRTNIHGVTRIAIVNAHVLDSDGRLYRVADLVIESGTNKQTFDLFSAGAAEFVNREVYEKKKTEFSTGFQSTSLYLVREIAVENCEHESHNWVDISISLEGGTFFLSLHSDEGLQVEAGVLYRSEPQVSAAA